MSSTLNNEFKIRIVIAFCACSLLFYQMNIGFKQFDEVQQNGIYTVGYYQEARSKSSYYEFLYKGKVYSARTAVGDAKKAIFVKFLPYKPKRNFILNKVPLPNCFIKDSIPEEGWKELPKIVCPEDKKTAY